MATPTMSIKEMVTSGDRVLTITNEFSGSQRISLEESIANATTNGQVNVAIDVSKLIAIVINSTQNVTLETNDGSTPDDTIALEANVPYVWHENSYHSLLLTADVTALFITNASGAAATITVEALVDAT